MIRNFSHSFTIYIKKKKKKKKVNHIARKQTQACFEKNESCLNM